MIIRSLDFFMRLATALGQLNNAPLTEFRHLGEVLCPDLVKDCLSRCGVATIRRRKLPMESMLWAVIGMALFRQFPMRQLLNQLDIILPNERRYVASSAVTHTN